MLSSPWQLRSTRRVDKVKPYEADEMPRSWLTEPLSDDEQQHKVASGMVTQRNQTMLDPPNKGDPVASNSGPKAIAGTTGVVPAMKPEATAILAPQDGRWKITVSLDGRRFCVPKFRH